MERQVELKNPSGLHARPASLFVAEANKFASEIFVEAKGKRVNAKSILGLLTLAISQGTTIKIIAEGSDAEQAVEALVNLVASGFGE
ncbi:Phosphotransferase system, phosphocarrier protein HPr [Alicyclobacillus hesperidum URH17-3-68]|uniref:Phosphocarrier protein HPr n=1 Tax=Alicyclobacillus hesperidum TaxID=89784 RepID=A0A1H2W5Q3_9BACL|nr:HPr family phosphocarrier protein [Alicyclobacillus hesperidum]KRW91319.1 phosphocarrier protein HPr [Alicyclobacillus tengchongensis]EJY56213.1 Phosphotransferase system, phosphocarrier protein HPr [Alicyclobacillus hesperidum URH17-3-68]SDW75419.1 phosphocarrier protein [Alicyclobacillus hesperidum]GLG00175.1 PTS sugar transporter subunit IIA [Alicyclobacillus hesperidum subsp. aegles]GLV14809.1 PTS sugar transporter subunit IIA [Alicyclobacillus hesperidum]